MQLGKFTIQHTDVKHDTVNQERRPSVTHISSRPFVAKHTNQTAAIITLINIVLSNLINAKRLS